ncbi:TonB-dependent receptor [Ponticaulis sp.]|uniref:TonB-dependent receptor n=1 Tax=Ponticaulis sp. TaxID=2020902 RepID=UPI000B7442BF|nr:TonB-dependent receptor [Ponticaulis sp.]MAI91912.1 TonB-dependent receptor [Ponticaulis sp.]OUX96589.1 MAG: TonB-dependent receptor [Hyphomonadaceae bacterium TMED5]
MSRFVNVFLGATLLAGAGTAFAQDEGGNDRRLDPVTVSVTRVEQPVSDLPASVSVLDGERLALASSYLGAGDLTDLATGIEAAIANGTQVAFQIRGIGAVDHQALTPSAAAVYSDGVFLATNVQTGLMLYDLERVEVLKGPQGTLYGRNASSGAVNLISVRPSGDQTRYVRIGVGNYDRFDAAGAFGASLNDMVSYRIAGNYTSRGPVLDNVSGPSVAGGETDQFGLRAGLLFDMDASELLLRAHYEEDNGVNTTPRNDSLDLDDFEISSEGDGIQDTDNGFYGASAEYTRSLGAWEVFSLTSVEGYEQNYGFDFDGTPAPFGNYSLNANLYYEREYVQVSEELRLSRKTGYGHALYGVALSADEFQQRYTIWCGELDLETLVSSCSYVGAPGRVGPNPASTGTATTLITDIEQSRQTLALFTSHQFDLSDVLQFTVGARLTDETIEGEGMGLHVFDDGVIAFNNRDGLGDAIGENTISETRLSGNAALSYDLSAGMAYASLSTGYKSGGFNGEVANNATHYSDEGLFSAETVTAWEVGFKSAPNPRYSYSLAAFYLDYNDPQARIFVSFTLPDGSQITSNSLSNLDEAVSYGLEADFSLRATEALTLNGGLTLNETEISQTSNIGGNAATFDGNPLPFAPDTSITLGGSYAFDLTDNISALASLHGKYRSQYFLDAEGLTERSQDGFTTLQAALDLAFANSDVTLSLWGRNLTDEDYSVSGYGFIGYNTFRSEPRTFGVSLEYQF